MAAADFTSSMALWERCLLITRAALVADRAAAVVSMSEAGLVSASRSLKIAEKNLAVAKEALALAEESLVLACERCAAADAEPECAPASALPDGYTVVGGYLHFDGLCLGLMAD